jgi:hypothetical protein
MDPLTDQTAGSQLHGATRSTEPEEFFPKGAIAFFVSLMAGFALIWGGIYLLMLHRQFHL